MALHFIIGRAGSGKTFQCAKEIREYVLGASNRKAFLIVPDQGTYMAESMLAKSFPGEGFTDVTVCGFSRLAYRVFQELRSPVADALSPLGQQLIIRRLLEEHKEELSVLERTASYPHFSEELTNFFHQLDLYCVAKEDLLSAANREGDTPLGRKLKDLHLLYDAYGEYLRTHFSYEGSLFDLLCKEIPKSKMIQGSRVWIDGFSGMAPQKVNIVQALLHTAEDVTVTLQMDPPEASEGNMNFARPLQLYKMLQGKARHSSSLYLKDRPRFQSAALSEMTHSFFHRRSERSSLSKNSLSPYEGLHIVKAMTKAEEVDFIARRIQTLVREEGYRYRDIMVLLRNPSDYADLLDRSFDVYKIPAFIDKEQAMNNHPLVVLLDRLLRFLTLEEKRKGSGWKREILFSMLKTYLFPQFQEETVDVLENYVLAHRIRSHQWLTRWDFRKLFSLDEALSPLSDAEILEQKEMNEYRTQLVDALLPLSSAFSAAKSVKEKCALLYRWLMAQKIPEKIYAMDEEYAQGNLRPHLQVWKKIISLFDEIVHVAGNDRLKSEDFLSIFTDGLSALTYSTIPPTLDHVTVTGMDRGYGLEAKAVFIPGALEGDFPRKVEESGFFTESEKQKLSQDSALIFGSDLSQMLHEEQFYFYLALTRARNYLSVSYPEIKGDGSESEPSFAISELLRLGYATKIEIALPAASSRDDASFFSSPIQALSLLPGIMREGLPQEGSYWRSLYSWAMKHPTYKGVLEEKLKSLSYKNTISPLPKELAAKLFKPEGRFMSSVTRLESYRSCPYKYFLQYGLKIQERDEGEMELYDFGNYLHAGLHRFGSALTKHKKQWRDVTDEELSSISETITEELSKKLRNGILESDGTSKYTKRALHTTFTRTLESLRNWSRHSSFDTKELEKEFLLRLSAEDGDSLTLVGKIDRIDQTENHVAIFDYKTGRTTASLQEIVAGLKLQLLTYLLALKEGGMKSDLLPTALMYIYLVGDVQQVSQVPPGGIPPFSPKDNTSGYLSSDGGSLKLLDSEVGTEDSFLKAKFNKDGTIRKSVSILTEEEFDALLTIVKNKIISLYQNMCDGNIALRPVKYKDSTPCDYCPYRSVCRFDPTLAGERYDYVNLPSDTDLKNQLASIAEGNAPTRMKKDGEEDE